jgi:hypothetical protein
MSATSITVVGSPPTSASDVTIDAYTDSAAACVTPNSYPVYLASITSCTSAEDYSSQCPCFNCGHVGHYAWQYRAPERDRAPRDPTSMVIQPRGQLRGPTPRSGRVNHTRIEDIPEGEEVHANTFLLFGCPIIILFDSERHMAS